MMSLEILRKRLKELKEQESIDKNRRITDLETQVKKISQKLGLDFPIQIPQ